MTRAAVAVLAALALGAGTARAAAPWRTVAVTDEQCAIGIPSGWRVVPRSTERLTEVAKTLRARKQTALALQYEQIAAVRRVTRVVYPFQAFAWPPPKGAVVPDVTVKSDGLSKGTTAATLPLIAREIVKSLQRSAAATASAPVALRLPAGRALQVTGTMQLSKTVRSRFALYLLIHGRKLYSLTFRGPATSAEAGIVQHFRFV